MNTLELLTVTINSLEIIQNINDAPVQRLLDYQFIARLKDNLSFIQQEMYKGAVPVNPVN